MGWEGIGTLIGTISSWFTPEKVKARGRIKLQKLKEEENDLFFKESNAKNSARLVIIRRDIHRLQGVLKEN